MADPILTSSACDGETCSVQLGVDETSLDPNKRLGIVKKDNRTIVCDDAIDGGGSLPGGIKVNICVEGPEVPYAARSTDVRDGNALRVQESADPDVDCGLVVLPPLVATLSDGDRVTILQNVDPDGADGPLDPAPLVLSAVSKTIVLTNNDTVDRLYTIHGLASTIVEIGVTPNSGAEMQVAIRTTSDLPLMNGGGLVLERVVTLVYFPDVPPNDGGGDGAYDGRTINDRRDITDHIKLGPGQTATLEYQARTIRSFNMTAVPPNRGFSFADICVRSEQVRSS